MMQNKQLFYGCVSFRPKFRKPVMVNMSDLLLVVCRCDSFGLFIFLVVRRDANIHSAHIKVSQCKFDLKIRGNKS